jgi:hypothetical protein
MKRAKHTNWTVVSDFITLENVNTNKKTTVDQYRIVDDVHGQVAGGLLNKSNAALIAAAPEMLEALQLILNDDRLMNAMSKDQAKAVMYSVSKAQGGGK